jgi:hypothetical protein
MKKAPMAPFLLAGRHKWRSYNMHDFRMVGIYADR